MSKAEMIRKTPPVDAPESLDKDPAHYFEDNEPDPDQYLLRRWLELAEAVLRNRDSDLGNDEDDGKRRPN